MIRVLIDSSSDYPKEEREAKNLLYAPLNLHFDEETYLDGVTLIKDAFYDKLINCENFPKTSQPSPDAFLKYFEEAKANNDEIICILLSSALSGTCQSAHLAKDLCDYDKIHIIDSLTGTYGIKLLVDYALELIEQGLEVKDIIQKVENLRDRTTIYISLDTLEYLYKGGRLSRASATIGSIANLKPTITVTDEGTVSVFKKSIGKNKATTAIIDSINNAKPDPNFPLYTLYSIGTDNCDKLEAKLKAAGYESAGRGQVGGTIGAHLGPNLYGVTYIREK